MGFFGDCSLFFAFVGGLTLSIGVRKWWSVTSGCLILRLFPVLLPKGCVFVRSGLAGLIRCTDVIDIRRIPINLISHQSRRSGHGVAYDGVDLLHAGNHRRGDLQREYCAEYKYNLLQLVNVVLLHSYLF